MIIRPLDYFSEVLTSTGQWSREWYSWLQQLCAELPVTGSATFAAGTSVAVTFASAQPDTAYVVTPEPSENKTFWVTSKTTTGFTLNSSASTSATVRWVLTR